MQQAVTAAAAEVAAAAGVVAARAVARPRLAVARLMAALAMAARVAAAEPVGAAAAVAVALAFGLEAAGAAPEETTPTAGNGIQPRASGSPSAINGKSGRWAERLPGAVADDEAGVVVLLDHPMRREAARGGHGAMIARGLVRQNA